MTDISPLWAQELEPIAFPLVNRFFKANGHKGKAKGGERVWVLRQGEIVAALRACPKAHGYLLRSVWVSSGRRRESLGTTLLQQSLSQLPTCWCYAYPHLEQFYQRAGFITVEPEQTPADIHEPYRRYQQQGLLLMTCE